MHEVLRHEPSAGHALPAEPPAATLSTLERLEAVRETAERPPRVLVVEDDPDHRDFIGWAFEEAGGPVSLQWAPTGEDALDRLHHGPPGERPTLILLDLNLPGGGGLATLAAIRRDFSLRTIPVVVFTGSGRDADIKRCYELGANSYFTKPATMEGYRSIIRILETYWLKATLPRG